MTSGPPDGAVASTALATCEVSGADYGVQIQQYGSNDGNNQHWQLISADGTGPYQVMSVKSGLFFVFLPGPDTLWSRSTAAKVSGSYQARSHGA